MAKRRHICDVPLCGRPRARWQRLCDPCFRALPGDIRTAIIDCWRKGDKAGWRLAVRRAGEHVQQETERRNAAARDAYERQQRLLGEAPSHDFPPASKGEPHG